MHQNRRRDQLYERLAPVRTATRLAMGSLCPRLQLEFRVLGRQSVGLQQELGADSVRAENTASEQTPARVARGLRPKRSMPVNPRLLLDNPNCPCERGGNESAPSIACVSPHSALDRRGRPRCTKPPWLFPPSCLRCHLLLRYRSSWTKSRRQVLATADDCTNQNQ